MIDRGKRGGTLGLRKVSELREIVKHAVYQRPGICEFDILRDALAMSDVVERQAVAHRYIERTARYHRFIELADDSARQTIAPVGLCNFIQCMPIRGCVEQQQTL